MMKRLESNIRVFLSFDRTICYQMESNQLRGIASASKKQIDIRPASTSVVRATASDLQPHPQSRSKFNVSEPPQI
jgi:hypothetical protein